MRSVRPSAATLVHLAGAATACLAVFFGAVAVIVWVDRVPSGQTLGEGDFYPALVIAVVSLVASVLLRRVHRRTGSIASADGHVRTGAERPGGAAHPE